MAFPLDRSAYVKVGADKGLEFLDELAPATVYDKCNWRCMECGLTYNKTYRAVYLGKHGCRCQNGMSMSITKYMELEQKFNIELISKSNNFMKPSKWYSPVTGNTVMVSYYQLVNAPLKNAELLLQLGIDVRRDDKDSIVPRRFRKVTYEVNGKVVAAPSTLLTEDSTDEDKERAQKKAQRLIRKHFKEVSKFRMLNQEEEQGILEVYDN